VKIATLDPPVGYANAIDDKLADAVAVLDVFHVVRLELNAMEDTRRETPPLNGTSPGCHGTSQVLSPPHVTSRWQRSVRHPAWLLPHVGQSRCGEGAPSEELDGAARVGAPHPSAHP
jgi:hypothetical protein